MSYDYRLGADCLPGRNLSELRLTWLGQKDKGMLVLFVMFGNSLKDIPKYSDLPKYYQTNDELVIGNKTYKKEILSSKHQLQWYS
jgi:hypothetical protein